MCKETEEDRNRKIREKINAMCLMNDCYMNVFFDDFNEGMELVLRIILRQPDLTVLKVKTQEFMQNLYGRSVKLDIFARDSCGKIYNIEIQNDPAQVSAKRSRYHSSMIDCNVLDPGDDFKKLPESFVIFINKKDIFGDGAPFHTIKRFDERTKEPFDDGTTIIYVNGEYRNNESEIGKLMSDFMCANPDEMNYNVLKKRAKYFKDERVTIMRDVFEEERAEGRAEGQESGIKAMIYENVEENIPEDKIKAKLIKFFSLSEEDAERFIEKYAKHPA